MTAALSDYLLLLVFALTAEDNIGTAAGMGLLASAGVDARYPGHRLAGC